MDLLVLPAIIEQALPAIVTLIVFGTPLAFLHMVRTFRLREKELDLRRLLAERPRDEEVAALEERVSRLERDRVFFERLADRAMRNADTRPNLGSKPRVAGVVDALANLDASSELEGGALYSSARSVHVP
jgi:hypothetical protein